MFTLIVLIASQSASANLILNGSFESNDVRKNSWQWFAANNVDGWNGSNIEIWDSYSGVNAFEGTQFAELNAHAGDGQAFSIFQTISTDAGSYYDLSFSYRARRSSTEAFLLSLISSDNTVENIRIDDHLVGKWSNFNHNFKARDLMTTVRFTALSPTTGTVGNFIDDVRLTKEPSLSASSIPEPSTIMIVFVGLALISMRKTLLGNFPKIEG